MPYTRMAAQRERERCQGDLVYGLFRMPGLPVPADNKPLIDFLVGTAYEFLEKKYSPDFGSNRVIAQARSFLTTGNDTGIKTWFFLFVLARETEVQDFVRTSYRADHPGNLWGEHAPAHFDEWLAMLKAAVEQTLNFPCNWHNMKTIVSNMLSAAFRFYMTGGTLPSPP
jgi:hypothetical protein